MSVIRISNIIWIPSEEAKKLPTEVYIEITPQEEKEYYMNMERGYFDRESDWFVAIQRYADANIRQFMHECVSNAFSGAVALGFRVRPYKSSPTAVVYSGPL